MNSFHFEENILVFPRHFKEVRRHYIVKIFILLIWYLVTYLTKTSRFFFYFPFSLYLQDVINVVNQYDIQWNRDIATSPLDKILIQSWTIDQTLRQNSKRVLFYLPGKNKLLLLFFI